MAYNKLMFIFFVAIFFFSCASETNKEIEEKSNEVSISNSNAEIEGNTYVITTNLSHNKGEEVIAEFELLDESLGKNFIVKYNPAIHQVSQVMQTKLPLTKDLFNSKNYIFIQHDVSSYVEWEKKFLLFDGTRKAFNIKVISVLTYHNDPNNVTVIASYSDLPSVTKYGQLILGSETMDHAGVTSVPKILLMTK